MGVLMQQVMAELATLADEEQEAFAAILLAEIKSERRWEESFARSQELLAKLANDALAEHIRRPSGA
jgi:hypothetical protein